MGFIKKYSLEGHEQGSVEIADSLLVEGVSSQMIKDYIVAIRNNARQWSANTKTRSEVSHSGKKPHAQKGGGRSRQGSLSAPQYKGGGVVFGPRPVAERLPTRINRKERRLAVKSLLSEKIREQDLIVLNYNPLIEPKTRLFVSFLRQMGWQRGTRVLFVREGAEGMVGIALKDRYQTLHKSVRNIEKTDTAILPNLNGYELLLAKKIVVLESAIEMFVDLLKG